MLIMQNSLTLTDLASRTREAAQRIVQSVSGATLTGVVRDMLMCPRQFWRQQYENPIDRSTLLRGIVLPSICAAPVLGFLRYTIVGIDIPIWKTWRAPLVDSVWFYASYACWLALALIGCSFLINEFAKRMLSSRDTSSSRDTGNVLQPYIVRIVSFSMIFVAVGECLRVSYAQTPVVLSVLSYCYAAAMLVLGLLMTPPLTPLASRRVWPVLVASCVALMLASRGAVSIVTLQGVTLLNAPRAPESEIAVELRDTIKHLAVSTDSPL